MRYQRLAIGAIFLLALHVEGQDNGNMNWFCRQETEFCYKVSFAQKTFHDAKQFCNADGSQLVSITSVAENGYVARLCGCQPCWLGLVERTEGDWYWLDGSDSKYRNWFHTQPDNWM